MSSSAARVLADQLSLPLSSPVGPPEGPPGVAVTRVQARSALVRSRVPGMDFAVNPFTGCGFACSYCYAAFLCRWKRRPSEDWGRFVEVKANLPGVLDRELRRVRGAPAVLMSSVTDPYQDVEAGEGVSRGVLEVLLRHRFRGRLTIMTKSPLVLRDLELLRRLRADVGLSIATADDRAARVFEERTPSIGDRLDALAALNDAGVRTHVFAGPLLPHRLDEPDEVDRLFAAIAATGTREVLVAWMNLSRATIELSVSARGEVMLASYQAPGDPGAVSKGIHEISCVNPVSVIGIARSFG